MHKAICLIIIGLAITLNSFCQQRAGSVSGTITNQAGQPVENLTVFIPSTSIGSTTNSRGEFTLDKLKSGLVELIFRHIAYLPESRNIEIIGGVNLKIDIVVKENTIEID